jgi:hypothetical protein
MLSSTQEMVPSTHNTFSKSNGKDKATGGNKDEDKREDNRNGKGVGVTNLGPPGASLKLSFPPQNLDKLLLLLWNK